MKQCQSLCKQALHIELAKKRVNQHQSYRLDSPWRANYNVRAAVHTLQYFYVLRFRNASIKDCNPRLLCHGLIESIELAGDLQKERKKLTYNKDSCALPTKD